MRSARPKFPTLLTLILAAVLAAPASGQAVQGVAAVVNDDVISTYDVQQRMLLFLATTGVRPNQELLMRIQEQALNTLIDERLQLQQAEEYEIEIDPAEVENAMADIASQNNVSTNEIREELERAGVDPATLEDQLRAEIAWQIMVNSRYRPRVRVSNDQIEQRLERIADGSSRPQYLISEILIEPEQGESDVETGVRVQAIVDQLNSGAQFPAVARQVSAAASAIDGGDVGWVRSGDLKPEVEAALQTIAPGNLTAPITTQDGVYLIAYRDMRSGSDPERVTLQQVMAPVPAGVEPATVSRALERAARGFEGCEDIDRMLDRADGATVTDLGRLAPSELADDFRGAVAPLSPGEISAPIERPGAVVMLAVCSRDRISGEDLPSREEVESDLMNEQLSLAARRWLRDLRRDATIETRVGP